MDRLAGKVAIVTGAASGMGAAQSRLFAGEGAKVVLADLNPEGARNAEALGPQAMFVRHDVASEESWTALVKAAEERFGAPNILVNTAGISIFESIETTTVKMFDDQYRVNQLGVFLGIRSVVDAMRRAGGGSIVNISSAAALTAAPQLIGYAAAKWAVRGMTRSAAAELAVHGIRVNTIFPGLIDTPMLHKNTKEMNDEMAAMAALKRMGRPEEIAQATLFLASDESSYVTGAELAVTGGSVT